MTKPDNVERFNLENDGKDNTTVTKSPTGDFVRYVEYRSLLDAYNILCRDMARTTTVGGVIMPASDFRTPNLETDSLYPGKAVWDRRPKEEGQ